MRISDWSSDVCSSDLFDVVDDQLRPLVSAGTRESYELKHCAEFVGRVEEVPMLAVGTYGLKEERLAEYVKAQEDLQATSSDQVQIGRASCRERVCQYV